MPSSTFVFVGSKGGAGSTTICCKFAQAMRENGSVALVDGDLSGRRGAAVLLDGVQALDDSRGAGTSVVSASVDGITLAELVDSYEGAFTLRREDVEQLAASLAAFNTVVVDAPQPFAAAMRPFVMRAARFFVVTEPNLLGMTGARSRVRDLQRFGIPTNRIAVVSNARDGGRDAIASKEIERVLGVKIVTELPRLTDRHYRGAIAGLQQYATGVAREVLPDMALQLSAKNPRGNPSWDRSNPITTAGLIANGAHASVPAATGYLPTHEVLKLEVHEALSKRIDLAAASRAHSDDASKLAELRAQVEEITRAVLSMHPEVASAEEIAQIRGEIVNEVLGLGPLEDLLHDPTVTEIMVHGADNIYVERAGKIEETSKRFNNDRQLRLVIERIIAPLGRRIDESVPMVDARLQDGSRVNAIIEPLSIDGPALTIRRFGTERLQMEDLLRLRSVTQPIADFLRAAVEGRLNIVISGGTGSGKTTFLNVLSAFIPDGERIITIEDTAELLLDKRHVVRLESRPPNLEGRGEVIIRDLLRNSLRMRPDRIIIGECRGAEALDMLQAMNTGHDGSLTTIHANSPRDALSRIETMVLLAGFDLPVRAIREQVASAIDMIVQTDRLRDGSRKIVSVSEVAGMEGDIITMQDIVRFAQRGVDKENAVMGEFQYTGVQPQCLKRFEEHGIRYDMRALSSLASAGAPW